MRFFRTSAKRTYILASLQVNETVFPTRSPFAIIAYVV